jgi:hypothetical protein
VAERTVKQIVPVSGWVYVTYGRDEDGPAIYTEDVAALAWVETSAEYGTEDRFLPLIREERGGEWVIPADEPSDVVTKDYFDSRSGRTVLSGRAAKLIEAGSE